ncbi:MAG: saccharopine dehydrogenase NADP-binding domain-containing protein [Gammaproteobacteria bacterium]|nr:saccharopine dehydrogenase NADP-binding domain-containing protein [Gammaproteobacteria bacterium]MBT8111657.1 saccharopine dehydrogenase NADP-binding domain-containing protein [Gammaproteobacteria bacterium]NND47833.1 saccharopine dehydrogenase [Woeseiaceae bacterium]NNL46355.1 saccharopine dehydrogenase [Woeseiaceae bacterium]
MSKTNSEREFDVIVWGATGFTGTLVAEYLMRQYGTDGDLKWAIAGRSKEKLEKLRQSLGVRPGDLETIVADSFDKDSLANLARRTRVVLTTVGPYALYGSSLVDACVEAGTHYCDLAGEVQWIRKMIDQHQARAQQTGARIVHCCGFDSVPMDIGVWFLQDAAKQRYGAYCKSIALLVKATKGTASGGTIASMMNLIQESRKDRDVARILVHPYSLNPEGERDGPDKRDQQSVLYDKNAQSWTAPFVMAGVNTKVVRRSHALLGYPYGKDFRYREAVMTGDGAAGWVKGATMTAAIGGLVVGASFAPTRKLLQTFILPDPGEGPSPELQKTGFFNLMQIGELPDGTLIQTRITGDQDPGYGSTSKMLSECAVCLAKDAIAVGGGVWTPASAMGGLLLERLRKNAGLTFEIRD